jgi:putative chitinase
MMATDYHECDGKFQPIEEYGKGKGRPYGSKLKMSRRPYTTPNKIYFGRGRVQLTWYENYELMGRLLRVDLLNKPELALDPIIATKIMFEGMTKGSSSFGDFTGKCLEMYFNKTTNDPINARRIINGTDKARMIAGYYEEFLKCLV